MLFRVYLISLTLKVHCTLEEHVTISEDILLVTVVNFTSYHGSHTGIILSHIVVLIIL